ncbi:hypothetical protein WAI453_012458 [Rhynchosporium graminicola]
MNTLASRMALCKDTGRKHADVAYAFMGLDYVYCRLSFHQPSTWKVFQKAKSGVWKGGSGWYPKEKKKELASDESVAFRNCFIKHPPGSNPDGSAGERAGGL